MAAPALLLCCSLAMVAVAAAWDVRTGLIPNWLTLGGLGLGLCLHVAAHMLALYESGLGGAALAGVIDAGLGMFSCALAPYLLFRADALGGGDVKLLAAVGAFTGPLLGLEVELSAFVGMALFAPIRLAYDGKLLTALGNTLVLIANPFRPKARRRAVPRELLTALKFGPAVFVANLIVAAAHWMDR